MILVLLAEKTQMYDDLNELKNDLSDKINRSDKKEKSEVIATLRNRRYYIYDLKEKHFFDARQVFIDLADTLEKEKEK